MLSTEPIWLAENFLIRSAGSDCSSVRAKVTVKAWLDGNRTSALIKIRDTFKPAAITADSHGSGRDYDLFHVQFLGEPLINGDVCAKESHYPNCVKQKEHLKAIRFGEELKLLDFQPLNGQAGPPGGGGWRVGVGGGGILASLK